MQVIIGVDLIAPENTIRVLELCTLITYISASSGKIYNLKLAEKTD